jgi:hypothetical protein
MPLVSLWKMRKKTCVSSPFQHLDRSQRGHSQAHKLNVDGSGHLEGPLSPQRSTFASGLEGKRAARIGVLCTTT